MGKRTSRGTAPPESKHFRKMGLGCNPEYRDFVPSFPVGFDPLVVPPRKQGVSVYVNEGHKSGATFTLPEGMAPAKAEAFREKMKLQGVREKARKKEKGPGRAEVVDKMFAEAGLSVDDF